VVNVRSEIVACIKENLGFLVFYIKEVISVVGGNYVLLLYGNLSLVF
jgi:hypothetical protein